MPTLDPDQLIALRHIARRPLDRRKRDLPVTALPGGQVTKRRGPGLETADIRPFAFGDDPRHIDRNATARTGQPFVRSFHAERDRTTVLIADFRPSMLWGTRRTFRSIAAAEALCIEGWQAVGSGGRVAAIAVTGGESFFAPIRGRDRGMVGVIGVLAQAHAAAMAAVDAPEPPLSRALEMACGLSPVGASVLLASALDTPGAGFGDATLALARRARLSVLRITDPFERDAPAGSYPFRSRDGAIGLVALRDGTRLQKGDDLLTGMAVPVVEIDAGAPPDIGAGHA